MANNYQRTSSAVEGRNGLARLHHSGRGFSPQTLKALTIIHNFHLQRPVISEKEFTVFDKGVLDPVIHSADLSGNLFLGNHLLMAQLPLSAYLAMNFLTCLSGWLIIWVNFPSLVSRQNHKV